MKRRRVAWVTFSCVAWAAFGCGRGLHAETGGRVPVQSSSLASIGYDSSTQVLEVEFHDGSIYRYAAVPPGVHRDFLAARSKGRFFATFVRGRYAFEKTRGSR